MGSDLVLYKMAMEKKNICWLESAERSARYPCPLTLKENIFETRYRVSLVHARITLKIVRKIPPPFHESY